MRRSDQQQVYDQLLDVIRGVRRRWRLRVLIRGLAAVGGVALVAVLGAGLLVARVDPDPPTLAWVRAGLAAVVALAALVLLVRPLLRRVSDETVALYLEEHEPSLEAAVVSALEARNEERSPASEALLFRTVEAAVERCHAIDDGRWVEQRPLMRVGAALAGVLLLGALAGFFGPFAGSSLFSSPRPAEAAGPRAVLVEPGDATVSRGADASISALLRGFDVSLVELAVRTVGDSAFDRLAMAAGADGRFGFLLFDLEDDTEYYVQAGDLRSPLFTLTVAELPYVDRMELELVYPAYTGLPSRTIEDGGDVAALRGTTVRVRVTPTLPVDGGGIVVDGGDPVPLAVDTATGELTGAFRVRADGFYHIRLDGPDGVEVDGSPRYVIDALSDGDPIVSFTEPGRDERVNAIDEVFVEARAEDDYGVGNLTLHYSVNGGPERTEALYGGRGGLKEVAAGHTFYLEEYGLEPGDLIAYYATATDNDAVGGGKRATSDIYFIQVRPFSRDFRAAEQQGMPQQGGGQQGADGDLSELQRQIIAGTFNLVRDRAELSAEDVRENLNTLANAQERLRDQTNTLAGRMVARRVTRDTAFQKIAEILPRAAASMDSAAARLRAREPDDALPPEQRALQQLLRAEAIFREVQVSMGQQGGGGGGGAPNAEDLADLFELEMDKLRDQYETVDRGGARDSTSAQVDETMERLQELARRQQREDERRRREAAQGRGTAGGAAQRELAERVEEEARRLERLSRERSQPQLEEAARQLRSAAESMRRSAAGSEEGDRATERLREARRLLDRSRGDDLRRRAGETARRADELSREQRELGREAGAIQGQAAGPERESRARRLDARRQEQQRDVEELESDLLELAAEAGSEPDAANRLREAARQIAESRLEDKIDFSRQLARENVPERYVRDLEEDIQGDLDRVRDTLDGIEGRFGQAEPGEGEAEERALEQAGDLARGLESMRQRTQELREQASGNPRGGGGFSPEAVRQGRSEAGRRLEDAEALRRQLRAQGVDADDLEDVMAGLRALSDGRPFEDPEELARLQETLADQAKRLELELRVRAAGEESLRLFLSGDGAVDPAYRALVEEYYRSLSRESPER